MPRLIDAEKLRKDILDLPNCYNGFSDTYDKAYIIDVIDEQPTVNVCPYWDNESDYCALNKPADAEPARHGHWIYQETWEVFECSNCEDSAIRKFPYCPHCGAKMDEREEDE